MAKASRLRTRKTAAEKIRARPQMRDLAQELRRVSLFLERIGIVRRADDLDFLRDHFPALTLSLRRDQRAATIIEAPVIKRCTVGIIRQRVSAMICRLRRARAVVQFDERKILRIPPGPHPALHQHLFDWRGLNQRVSYRRRRKHGGTLDEPEETLKPRRQVLLEMEGHASSCPEFFGRSELDWHYSAAPPNILAE